MASLAMIKKHQTQNMQMKKKIKDLQTAVRYLDDTQGLLHNMLLYRRRNKIKNSQVDLVEGKTTFRFPSLVSLTSDYAHTQEMFTELEKLLKCNGNLKDFNTADVDYGNYVKAPTKVLKAGFHYDHEGFSAWKSFYIPHKTKYMTVTPQKDSKGYFFPGVGGKPIYYNKTSQSQSVSEESESEPESEPESDLDPKIPDKSSKVLLDRNGHGLSRLLAEAKDPPLIEFKGSLEEIKGFRKRAYAKYGHLIESVSSTYMWSHNKVRCCIFTFKSYTLRTEFIQLCTLRLPEYRLGAFDTE